MKKLLPLILVSILAIPFLGLAQEGQIPPLPNVPLTVQIVIEWMTTIANFMFAGLIFLAVIFLLIAGFRYLTAGGDATKIQTASRLIIYALVGVGIGIFAKGLIYLICSIVGVEHCVFF